MIGDADAVEEMAAPNAGLVVLDEQDPAPLAHQDLGQETRYGVDSLARGAADHDVQVYGHSFAFPGRDRAEFLSLPALSRLSIKLV